MQDPAKREYGEELLNYSDTFNIGIISSFKGDTAKEAGKTFQLNCLLSLYGILVT